MSTIEHVVRLTCRKPVALATLAERLSVPRPRLIREIKSAIRAGAQIEFVGDSVITRVRKGAGPVIQMGSATPGRHKVLHMTDLHAGSKHFDRDAFLDILQRGWDAGCRVVANTGDNLDGNKEVLLPEQRAWGFDDQSAELVEAVRQAPPFAWTAIDGNHDGYFSNSIGFISGRLLEARMREAGIDWTFAGVCLGRAIIHGAHWMLWHPHGGASTRNALRRILNARAEELQERCDVLAMGHFHKYVPIPIVPEGVLGIAGGTFQRKASEFANRISSNWDIGGSIVSYDLDKKGLVHHAAAEFLAA